MSKFTSAEIFEIIENKQQYRDWARGSSEFCINAHIKNSVTVAIKEELTKKQAQYFTMYFFQGYTMQTISQIMGVNKSTVSRTIRRSMQKLKRVLKYTDSRFLMNT